MSSINPASVGGVTARSDYRPDIDGLRAIAVLCVVIYHAFPSLIQGGFVGVDVFFVISGYLISKHILEELNDGAFRIRTFYARRVRRIFPALSVVLLACFIMGWVILSPGEYKQLGRHIFAGALFLSNFLLWKEAGYFDSAAETKPLLHLWSLGIEEQFYVVWPLLLILFWRFRRHLGWMLVGVFGISLTYSLYKVHYDTVADFYSPLTRFWELAMGAGLAFLARQNISASKASRSPISIFGLLLIIAAALVTKNNFLFPGAWALIPTVGAALMIFAGAKAWANRRLLSIPLLVWIGLISYPLYLWHWPMLVFARIMESGTPSIKVRFWLVAASFFLAWSTYKAVERPIRKGPRTAAVIWMLCLSVFGLGIAGFSVKSMDGIKSRQFSMMQGDTGTIVLGADREKLKHECGIEDAQKPMFQFCLKGGSDDARYALFGDSKAEALFYGLVRESPKDISWTMIGTVYPPDDDTALHDSRQHLKNRLALETFVGNQSIKVVVLVVALRTLFPIDSDTGFIAASASPHAGKIESFSIAIKQLEQAGKHVVFVIDNPTFPDPTSCISGGVTSNAFLNRFLRRKENPLCSLRYTDHMAGTRPYRQFVDELKRRHPKLVIYDPTPLLCDIPANTCAITQGDKFLYSYGDHISDYANSMLARDFFPHILRLAP